MVEKLLEIIDNIVNLYFFLEIFNPKNWLATPREYSKNHCRIIDSE